MPTATRAAILLSLILSSSTPAARSQAKAAALLSERFPEFYRAYTEYPNYHAEDYEHQSSFKELREQARGS